MDNSGTEEKSSLGLKQDPEDLAEKSERATKQISENRGVTHSKEARKKIQANNN